MRSACRDLSGQNRPLSPLRSVDSDENTATCRRPAAEVTDARRYGPWTSIRTMRLALVAFCIMTALAAPSVEAARALVDPPPRATLTLPLKNQTIDGVVSIIAILHEKNYQVPNH